MEIYNSEQEQVEAIKKWWKENGMAIVLGIALGLAGVFGWRWWVGHQQQVAAQASGLFTQVLGNFASNRPEQAQSAAKELEADHAGSAYAVMAAFAQAAQSVQSGDLAAAADRLRWALDNAKQPELQNTARLRLARVLLADGKADEALALVTGVDGGSYQPAYDEVRGDILAAKGQQEQAREAYTSALAALPATADNRDVVQMKLDDLAAPTAN